MTIKIVPTLTWYLEMKGRPVEIKSEQSEQPVVPDQPDQHIGLPDGFTAEPLTGRDPDPTSSSLHDLTSSTSIYLDTYKAVGGNYNWYDRLLMPAEELEAILRSDATEIWLLMHKGEVAGFVEYDHSVKGETEIVYFGLTARHTGKKAGYPFLLWAINHAWQKPITRLWLHTCDLDHPAALPLYQKAGFVVYKSITVMQRVLKDKAKG